MSIQTEKNLWIFRKGLFAVIILLFMADTAFSKDLLITNDTGTQGKGNLLVEVNSEFAFDKENADGISTKQSETTLESIFSYGLSADMDIIFVFSYLWTKTEENRSVTNKETGISDVTAEVKWKFHEKDGLSLAIKPGISLPAGNYNRGLGAGVATYNIFLIATKEVDPLIFHLNFAYLRNENNDENRKDIWYLSLSSEVPIGEKIRLTGNAGFQTNTDKNSNNPPAFISSGLNYSMTNSFDINLGLKGGINKPETDLAVLAGIAVRF